MEKLWKEILTDLVKNIIGVFVLMSFLLFCKINVLYVTLIIALLTMIYEAMQIKKHGEDYINKAIADCLVRMLVAVVYMGLWLVFNVTVV